MSADNPWLVGIDIDGTLVHDDGYLSDQVVEQVKRVKDLDCIPIRLERKTNGIDCLSP